MLLYFVLQLKPQSDCVSVTLKGQREQHVICTRSVKDEEACKLVNTHGAMASPKTKNRRHPLYNAGLSREEDGASPEGDGSTATYVHSSSLWVATLAPGSVHQERRREEGNANKRRRTEVPFSFGSENCAQQSTGHTVFPTAAAAWAREEEQASQRHRDKLSTQTMPPGGHVGSGAKRKMTQPPGRSPQHPGGFFALRTRQRQDALQLGRGCGLKEVFQSGSPHGGPPLRVDCSTAGTWGHPLSSSVVPLAPPALPPSPAVLPVLAAAPAPAGLRRRKGSPRRWGRRRPRRLPVRVSPLRVAWWQVARRRVARRRVARRWVARWNDARRWHDTRWSERGVYGGRWC